MNLYSNWAITILYYWPTSEAFVTFSCLCYCMSVCSVKPWFSCPLQIKTVVNNRQNTYNIYNSFQIRIKTISKKLRIDLNVPSYNFIWTSCVLQDLRKAGQSCL